MAIATRHECINRDRVSGRHTTGDGKPRRKSCEGCGSSLMVHEGGYGAVPHSGGTGRYRAEDVVHWFRTDAAATAWINDNDTTGTLVVRWFSA
jgi:hypothetical protein